MATGPIKVLLRKIRWILILILGGLLVLFALQNVQNVDLTFLFWTFESRRIVVIGFSVAVGLIVGWLFGAFGHRK